MSWPHLPTGAAPAAEAFAKAIPAREAALGKLAGDLARDHAATSRSGRGANRSPPAVRSISGVRPTATSSEKKNAWPQLCLVRPLMRKTSGTITATVGNVLPNGHLLVSGEKQIGVNQNIDTLQFSGQVDPQAIAPGNVVHFGAAEVVTAGA